MVTVGWSWYYGTCARFYHCSIFGHHLWCREVRFLKNYWLMAKVFLIAIFEIQWLWQSIYRRYAFPGKILNSILNCNMIFLLQTRIFSQNVHVHFTCVYTDSKVCISTALDTKILILTYKLYRSISILFACIGVTSPQLSMLQSRGSKSNAGEMDKTWSIRFIALNDLSLLYLQHCHICLFIVKSETLKQRL